MKLMRFQVQARSFSAALCLLFQNSHLSLQNHPFRRNPGCVDKFLQKWVQLLRLENKCQDMVVYTLHGLKCMLQYQILLFLNVLNYFLNSSVLLQFVGPGYPDIAENCCFALVFVRYLCKVQTIGIPCTMPMHIHNFGDVHCIFKMVCILISHMLCWRKSSELE